MAKALSQFAKRKDEQPIEPKPTVGRNLMVALSVGIADARRSSIKRASWQKTNSKLKIDRQLGQCPGWLNQVVIPPC